MTPNARINASRKSAPIALAMVASALAATVAQANTLENIVLVPPTALPATAQHDGDAILLHDTIDGRTLLYIEQDHGSRLTTLDVTDPAHVKAKGSMQLDSAQPFDFAGPLGSKAELLRFRAGHQYGVLDLHKETLPIFKASAATSLHGQVTPLGSDGYLVDGSATVTPAVLDYQVIEVANTQTLNRVFDLKQVREEVTNVNTGTTFFITENGLYLIRRPAVEADKRRRDQEWLFDHAGG